MPKSAQKTKLVWHTEKRKVSDLSEFSKNPRSISEAQLQILKESLEKFDLVEIPAVDTDGRIIAGHQRIKALTLLGREDESIEVRVPNRTLTRREFEEYNLRSNKNVGEWDEKLLKDFDKGLLLDAGFSPEEVDRMFALKVEEDDFDSGAEYKKIKTAKTKPGEVFRLGQHRLICGDATQPEAYRLLLGSLQADLVFTDPPYSVNYKSHEYHKGKQKRSYDSEAFGGTGQIFNDDKKPDEALAFYTEVLKQIGEFTKDNATLYWWFANAMNWINRQAWHAAGWRMSQIVIWVKNGMIFSPGQLFHRCYEPCMVGWKEKSRHYVNKGLNRYRDVFSLDFENFAEQLDV